MLSKLLAAEKIREYNELLFSLLSEDEFEEQISLAKIEEVKNYDNTNLTKFYLEYSDKAPIDFSMMASMRLVFKNKNQIILYDEFAEKVKRTSSELIYHRMNNKISSRRSSNLFKDFVKSVCEENKIPFFDNSKNVVLERYEDCVIVITNKSLDRYFLKNKAPDILIKIKNKVFVGEVKFVSDYGGSQNHQLEDAYSYLSFENGFCIIDGYYQVLAACGKENKITKPILTEDRCVSLFDFNILLKNLRKRCE